MDVVLMSYGRILDALLLTIQLSSVSIAGAAVLGLFVGLMRVSPVGSLQRFSIIYIEIIRSTPIAVVLVFIFFALPDVGIVLPPFAASAVGLSVYMSSYVAEAVRSGVNAVDVGHVEAARSLGLGQRDLLRFVVLPEAVRSVIPAFGNISVDLVKDTAIAYVISVMEITGTATMLVTEYADPIPIFLAAGACYMLLTLPLGWLFRVLEKLVAIVR